MTAIRETNLSNMLYRGKVRDTYDLGEGRLLIVATDRISAFDVVLPTAIPEKGVVLNSMSAFWFERTGGIVPNHLIELAAGREDLSLPDEVARRAMVVKRAERIERRVRGARLHHRLRLGRVPARGDRVRHGHARRAPRGRPLSRAAVHAHDQGRGRPR